MTTSSPARVERFRPLYEQVGWTLLPEIVQTNLAGTPVVISHYPYTGDSHGADRYAKHRPADEGLPVLHGHVHEKWTTLERQYNASVEVRDYRPVPVGVVEDWLHGLAKATRG